MLHKTIQAQTLSAYNTWITDTDLYSYYFKIFQLPPVLSAGKNSFLINGSSKLVNSTEVLVELTDSNGDTVFLQPIRNYNEGLSRFVSIEIYNDTPPGPAKLTILGEVTEDRNGVITPVEWRNRYNVKWSIDLMIDPTKINNSPIRLYNAPELSISEALSVYYQPTITTQSITSSAVTFSGVPAVQGVATPTAAPYLIYASQPIFSASMAGGTFTASLGVRYSTSISHVINSTLIQVDSPYRDTRLRSIPFASNNVTMSVYHSGTRSAVEDNRSYAIGELSNLNTFSGHIQFGRIYVRDVNTYSDYESVGTVRLEPKSLLTTQSITQQVNYNIGSLENSSSVATYWRANHITSASYLTSSVTPSGLLGYDTTYLMNSMYLSGSNGVSLAGSQSLHNICFIGPVNTLSFIKGTEYEFNFRSLCTKLTPLIEGKLEVYLVGSAFPATGSLGTKIGELTSPVGSTETYFDTTTISFVAPRTGTANLRFVMSSGQWHIAHVNMAVASEYQYTPNHASFTVPIIGRKNQYLQFKVELYNGNNELIPLELTSAPVYFDGGNTAIRGNDNRVIGSLIVARSGSGLFDVSQSGISITTNGIFRENGTFLPNTPAIFIGKGQIKNNNTPFLVASSSEGPVFSLGDKIIFSGSIFSISASSVSINTPNMTLRDSPSPGQIALGTPKPTVFGGSTGIYMDDTGKFFAGNPAGNRLSFDNGTVYFQADNWRYTAGSTLTLDSAGGGSLALGGATAFGAGNGVWLGGSSGGQFRVGNPAGAKLQWDGTTMTVSASTFTLSTTGIRIQSSNSEIALASATSLTVGTGLWMKGTGNGEFRVGDPTSNRLEWTGTNLIVSSALFYIAGGSVRLDSSGTGSFGSATHFGNGTGIWLGADGKFRAGTATGARLSWDGSNVIVSGTSFLENAVIGKLDGVGSTTLGNPIRTLSINNNFASIIHNISGLGTDSAEFNIKGGGASNPTAIKINDVKILGPQITGWSAWTGTSTRTSKATSTATTAEVAEALKALIDDLISHGLIGS